MKFKIQKLVESLLSESYKVIPDANDQSEILLNLAIGTAKRGIDNFDQKIGVFKQDIKNQMIKVGIQFLEGKISPEEYVKKLEKCFSKQAGIIIKLESSDVYKIISRLNSNNNIPKINVQR